MKKGRDELEQAIVDVIEYEIQKVLPIVDGYYDIKHLRSGNIRVKVSLLLKKKKVDDERVPGKDKGV